MYVHSINGWGEFDAGPLSGWMFAVNGVFPGYSSSARTLEDGDRVYWLFTRDLGNDLGAAVTNRSALRTQITRAEALTQADFTQVSWAAMQTALTSARQVYNNTTANQAAINTAANNLRDAIDALVRLAPGGSGGSGSSGGSGGGTGSSGTANVVAEIEAEIEGEVAIAEVEADKIQELIQQAIAEEAQGITIDVTNDADINRVEITLIVASLIELIENNMILTILSDIASMTFDIETLEGLVSEQDKDATVRIITEIAEPNANQQATMGERALIRFSIIIGDYEIHNFDGVVTVMIPFVPPYHMPESDYDLLTAYHLDSDGDITEMLGARHQNAYITFETSHFGLFFAKEWINPFDDVATNAWYLRNVRFVYTNGLMSGTGDGQFMPGLSLSRAMMVTILWRLEGEPAASHNAEIFNDVAAGSWYADAIAWASTNNIVMGYGNGMFGPSDNITREQLALILKNFADHLGVETYTTSFATDFEDEGSISPWALDAMMWANENGLITGRTQSTLVPEGTATRAEAAAIIQRFLETQ